MHNNLKLLYIYEWVAGNGCNFVIGKKIVKFDLMVATFIKTETFFLQPKKLSCNDIIAIN